MESVQDRDRFIAWLREELPKLLREDPSFASEVVGILAQTLSPRAELNRILEEIRDLREDFGRRFEAADRRFEAMERRFEAMDKRFEAIERRFEAMERRFEALQEEMDRRFQALQQEMDRRFELQARVLADHSRQLRRLTVGLGSLGRRFGLGFEEPVRAIVEEFAGLGPLVAERLVLRDEAGEVFGVKGQAVEFDAFVHDSQRFLVEAQGFAEPEDVLNFFRKVEFARKTLKEPFEPVLVAPFAHPRAVELSRQLGIHVLAAEEPEPA